VFKAISLSETTIKSTYISGLPMGISCISCFCIFYFVKQQASKHSLFQNLFAAVGSTLISTTDFDVMTRASILDRVITMQLESKFIK
jgi:Zn-finger protein